MTHSLEQFVNNVRTLSSQGNFSYLAEHLNECREMLTKNASNIDTALGALEPQSHALGILALLHAKCRLGSSVDFELLFIQVKDFLTKCNGEQIRHASAIFADLCHVVTAQLVKRKEALRGIGAMTKAVRKLQLSSQQLTSVHADLCQLCLAAKCLKPALEFLEVDVVDINKEGGSYGAKELLLYYYYGGMVYAALKQWSQALFFFEMAVTTPAMSVSHIMLEAYKKHLLVSLILNGKVEQLPKYTSQAVSRYIRPLCTAYQALTTAYASGSADELSAAVNSNQADYIRDQNMGLVRQCQASLYRSNIKKLTKTFVTLSLSDVASRVRLENAEAAEKQLLQMIEAGDIFASINQRDGMVEFNDNPEQYSSPGMMRTLDEQLDKSIGLSKKIKEMEKEIMVNPVFVRKSMGVTEDDVLGGAMGKLSSFMS